MGKIQSNFPLRSSFILNIENDDNDCFIWWMLPILPSFKKNILLEYQRLENIMMN